MKLVVTAVAAIALSTYAAADVDETLIEPHPSAFLDQTAPKQQPDNTATTDITASKDEVSLSIQETESQTDIDVETKIDEIESLVSKISSKDDELNSIIKELNAKKQEQKKLEQKKKQEILAKKSESKKPQSNIKNFVAKKKPTKKQTYSKGKKLNYNSAPMVAARKATRRSHARSTGMCAKYVRIALQSAGYRFTPNPSAYQYATRGTLRKAGFAKISNSSRPQIGDVAVISRSRAHPHGHMSIYNGKHWVSDFRQRNKNPYKKFYNYTVWRDARYLNGASTKGIYVAKK